MKKDPATLLVEGPLSHSQQLCTWARITLSPWASLFSLCSRNTFPQPSAVGSVHCPWHLSPDLSLPPAP